MHSCLKAFLVLMKTFSPVHRAKLLAYLHGFNLWNYSPKPDLFLVLQRVFFLQWDCVNSASQWLTLRTFEIHDLRPSFAVQSVCHASCWSSKNNVLSEYGKFSSLASIVRNVMSSSVLALQISKLNPEMIFIMFCWKTISLFEEWQF